MGEILSAFEFLDKEILDLTLRELPAVRNPLPSSHAQFYVMLETSGSNVGHDRAKLQACLSTKSCQDSKWKWNDTLSVWLHFETASDS